ncbi:hypothetical protein K443DRAFT_613489 [Laccaria amethystina LaAM-08-1]|uniref:Uncharacterized protein n=1 Tax=Laccaria amethystina LaAM-08-1 TaxID=1095629 RepID=A0A0C9XF72_9AGAR|nr:hypothetical protein K443DRAFT_613489 [Laccaria amethystina LaAM-08-1]
MSHPPNLSEIPLVGGKRCRNMNFKSDVIKVGGLDVHFMTRQPAKPASFYSSARKWHHGMRN